MKKRYFILLLALALCMGLTGAALADAEAIPIDEEHFPDESFRAYVHRLDSSGNGSLEAFEISMIHSVNCSGMGVASLQGLEYFRVLTILQCSNNRLTSLDVSMFPKLKTLECMNNELTSLDVTQNPNLSYLICSGNELTTLDVSQNPKMETLACIGNRLTSLDVSHNLRLFYLFCEDNELTELDISQNTELGILYCGSNRLTGLDTGSNAQLFILSCRGNAITSLDLSRNYALDGLDCSDNALTSLDVGGCYLARAVGSGGQWSTEDTKLYYYPVNPGPYGGGDYLLFDPSWELPADDVRIIDGQELHLTKWLCCDSDVEIIGGDQTDPGASPTPQPSPADEPTDEPTDEPVLQGDMDGDGRLTPNDAAIILQICAGG